MPKAYQNLAKMVFANCGGFSALFFAAHLRAETVTVRYMDEAAGFLVLDKIPGDWRDGDKLCVFDKKRSSSNCEVSFRRHTAQALLFPPKESMETFEVGMTLEVKKIYLGERDAVESQDVVGYQSTLEKAADKELGSDRTSDQLKRQKFPKGSAPPLNAESPVIEGDEFPEIIIPKIRKSRNKKQRDVSELAMIRKGLKRSLNTKTQLAYQFAGEDVAPPTPPATVREDYPNPLNGAIRFTIFNAYPLLPMADYQSLKFRTITNLTTERDRLWEQSRTRLTPDQGLGFNLQLTSRQRSFVNLGWRYHNYNSLKSRSTYDEVDVTLIALSRSRVSEQIVHFDWGRIQDWNDWVYTSWSWGSDVALTDVKFDSRVERTGGSDSFILATAKRSLTTLAPRILLSAGVERWGFGMNLGLLLQVPLNNLKESFEGEVTPPERVTFTGSPADDLKRSMTQQRNTIACEVLLGISYQPQRSPR